MKKKFKFSSKKKHLLKLQMLSTKVLALLMVSIILSVLITSVMSIASMNSMAIQMAESEATTSVKVMKNKIDSLKSTLGTSAGTIAGNSDLIKSVNEKNASAITQCATMLKNATGVPMCTVTDENGIVLCRTHDSSKTGDDISAQATVAASLKGTTSENVGSDEYTKLGVFASAPVYNLGKFIGTVTIAAPLNDTSIVDNLKATTGSDFTIFAGDERISTTLQQNGQRVNGTKLDSNLAAVILKNKQTYLGRESILGKNYITNYTPILSSDGESAIGVLFAGFELSKVEKMSNQNVTSNILAGFGAILVFSMLGYFIIRRNLKKPLAKIVKATNAIKEGNISQTVVDELTSKRKDEIGELSSSMLVAVGSLQQISQDANILVTAVASHDLSVSVDSEKYQGIYKTIIDIIKQLFDELGSIIYEIRNAADTISSGTSHVSDAAQSLAQGAAEQASSTEELAATINKISEQIQSSAQNAKVTSDLTVESGKEIADSNSHMQGMLAAMQDIKNSSEQISNIIKTINDIAFQTNILALNAAIEAARAGTAGKGFAVVADEVRNLANRSAKAAQNTAELIEDSAESVKKGLKIAGLTQESLGRVVQKTEQSNALVLDIAQAAISQNDSIHQVNTGVDQISGVVQTNSATAEETAAASEELAAQAQALNDLVKKYKLPEAIQQISEAKEFDEEFLANLIESDDELKKSVQADKY